MTPWFIQDWFMFPGGPQAVAIFWGIVFVITYLVIWRKDRKRFRGRR